MDLSNAVWWWIAAGVMVAAELATGSFYLLMIGLGLAAGAVSAHLGVGSSLQIVVAATLACAATGIWHWQRIHQPRSAPARENRDVNLDIGERVNVTGWNTDRTARVDYRGTQWTARLAPGAAAVPGPYEVAAVEGNWLVLAPL